MEQNLENKPHQAKKPNDRRYWIFGLRIAGDFVLTIAIPVVIFAYLGKQLDIRFGTAPWLLIAGFTLAAVLSALMIYRKAKRYGKEYQQLK